MAIKQQNFPFQGLQKLTKTWVFGMQICQPRRECVYKCKNALAFIE
jgi:hypothetical protein